MKDKKVLNEKELTEKELEKVTGGLVVFTSLIYCSKCNKSYWVDGWNNVGDKAYCPSCKEWSAIVKFVDDCFIMEPDNY